MGEGVNRLRNLALGSALAGSRLRRRLRLLRWILPASLLATVIVYEVGPSQWLRLHFEPSYHLIAEILVYGTVGPAVAFVLLHFLERWLEERETSDLQSRLLAHARRQTMSSRQLADRTLQELFAVSMQLTALKASLPGMPPEAAQQLDHLSALLDRTIQEFRDYLLNEEGNL